MEVEVINMDFLVGLPQTKSNMTPFEALYGRRYRSQIGWFEVGESSLLGPELIFKTLEKFHMIRNWLKTAYSRQKSYTDHRIRDFEFEESDKVYQKISPMEVVRLGRMGSQFLIMWVPMKFFKGLARLHAR